MPFAAALKVILDGTKKAQSKERYMIEWVENSLKETKNTYKWRSEFSHKFFSFIYEQADFYPTLIINSHCGDGHKG